MAPYAGEGLGGLSTKHAVTLSVRDSAALLDATCGAGPGDPYVAPGPERPFLAEAGTDPGRLSPHFSYRGVFGRQSLRRVVERGEESGGCGVNVLVSTFASLIAGSDP